MHAAPSHQQCLHQTYAVHFFIMQQRIALLPIQLVKFNYLIHPDFLWVSDGYCGTYIKTFVAPLGAPPAKVHCCPE